MDQQNLNNKRWYKSVGFNKTMGIGGGALDFGLTYHDMRKEGHGVAFSAMGGAATAAAWYFLPGVMWAKTAYDVANGLGGAMQQARLNSYEKQFAHNDSFGVIGGNFQDTEIGYTSRQRGVQAIQASRLNARSALANEARSLHRF